MDTEDRIISPLENELDNSENKLRPKVLEEFIGQKNVVDNLTIMTDSANIRAAALDHILLSGPPGLGKTTLAMLAAKGLNSELHLISGPALEKKGDLAAILTNLSPRDILFIDEIHRMSINIEEILYSAMEDFRLDIVIGQGATARTMQIEIPPFTLIGATTKSGLLSNPLRTRFIAGLHFDFYNHIELAKILKNNSYKLKISIDEDALLLMAKCSRGTPRIANRILKRVRDYALVDKKDYITKVHVKNSLKLMNIDHLGLDRMDRKIISVIKDFYDGGPVGIETLAATLGEDKNTIEDVYEPYLLQEGFIQRTGRGRKLLDKAIDNISNISI